MIRHIVLFNFLPSVSDEDREETLRRYRAMKAVPSMRSLELCTPVKTISRHARGNFQYAAVMTFDDVAGFEAYVKHPLHHTFDEGWVKNFLDEETIWSGQFQIEKLV